MSKIITLLPDRSKLALVKRSHLAERSRYTTLYRNEDYGIQMEAIVLRNKDGTPSDHTSEVWTLDDKSARNGFRKFPTFDALREYYNKRTLEK